MTSVRPCLRGYIFFKSKEGGVEAQTISKQNAPDIMDSTVCTVQQSSSYILEQNADFSEQTLQLALNELSTNYVAGFILKKIKKDTSCTTCRSALFGDQDSESNALIKAREYLGGFNKRLCYPSDKFALCFYRINKFLKKFIKENPSNKKLKNEFFEKITEDEDFAFLCGEHRDIFRKKILQIIFRTITHYWCRNINKVLSGRDNRPNFSDCRVMKVAQEMYVKRKKRIASGVKIM